jgi:phosphoglycerate dehydrogenase-like enzyme
VSAEGRPLRVLFHFDAGPELRARLAPRLMGLDVRWCAEDDEETLAALLPETEVLWHVLRPVTAADFDRAPRLRLVQKLGSGVNTIDLDRARSGGVAVANMAGANAQAVAEAALTLMLAALRRVVPLDAATRAGRGWPLNAGLADRVGEIAGRTVGLVGYGAVARRLEAPLLALGARVIRYSRSGDVTADGWRTLDDLLAEADIVSLHVPLTSSTEGLIDAARLARMRSGAILVNTSRGPVVDETALTAALRGHLGAAGLDVFAAEPVHPANPLLRLDNVVVLPHVAWLTGETLERCVDIAAGNARRLAAGKPLLNLVP